MNRKVDLGADLARRACGIEQYQSGTELLEGIGHDFLPSPVRGVGHSSIFLVIAQQIVCGLVACVTGAQINCSSGSKACPNAERWPGARPDSQIWLYLQPFPPFRRNLQLETNVRAHRASSHVPHPLGASMVGKARRSTEWRAFLLAAEPSPARISFFRCTC